MYTQKLTTETAFQRYEDIRARLPIAQFADTSLHCANLSVVAEHVDAFVLDAFGVLNVGGTAIPGAVERMAKLRAMSKKLIVLTNAASDGRVFTQQKYHSFGFDFTVDEIISSRDVCAAGLKAHLPDGRWGAICADTDIFADLDVDIVRWTANERPKVDGFLFLSSAAVDSGLMQALTDELQWDKRPILCANPDIVAPRETGLSCEPGYYVHALADQTGVEPVFFGKPFGNAFEAVLSQLTGIPANRIAMVGDTLHTDVLGGGAAGMRTVLIADHGLFAGEDIGHYIKRSGIQPDFICPTT